MAVVVCEPGDQGLDILEEKGLADVEGPACERHYEGVCVYV